MAHFVKLSKQMGTTSSLEIDVKSFAPMMSKTICVFGITATKFYTFKF
jgi:hypothetical protein